jgi:hypothetical protein
MTRPTNYVVYPARHQVANYVPQRLTEPRAEKEQQALHGDAERDRQPSRPEESDPEVG